MSWGVHVWNMFLGSYLRVREMYKGAFGEVREKMAEHKAVKKAKKGILSVVFSRTALVAVLILLQVGVLAALTQWPESLSQYQYLAYMIQTVIQAGVIIYIINTRGNPEVMCTWILLILVFPVFGCLFYIYVRLDLGNRYIGKKLEHEQLQTWPYMRQKKSIIEDLRLSKPANANLAYYMNHQLHYPTYRNTKAEYYKCGEDNFPIFLEELKKAKRFIFMEYFIVAEGRMWGGILEVLKQKAAQGVEVRFMYDGMCSVSLLPYNYPKEIQKLGIQCKMFSPIRPVLTTSQNNRDHRKICVIDGNVGFTGGINLADEYINEKERFGYWKDNAIMIKGDAVRSLTLLFLQMWNVTETGKEDYERYLVPQERELHRELGFITPYGDSPFDKENVGAEVYCHILNHAKKYVHVMTPYLIIDNQMVDTLTRAAKSGIDVKIIMPGIPDKWYAFAVAKTYYRDLISAGVKIYEFTPGFVHSKVFVSDDDTATVGTVNLDYRSLYLHFECGLFFYNNPVVRSVEKDFQETLRQCTSISVSDIKKISPFMMLCGRVLRLVAPLM